MQMLLMKGRSLILAVLVGALLVPLNAGPAAAVGPFDVMQDSGVDWNAMDWDPHSSTGSTNVGRGGSGGDNPLSYVYWSGPLDWDWWCHWNLSPEYAGTPVVTDFGPSRSLGIVVNAPEQAASWRDSLGGMGLPTTCDLNWSLGAGTPRGAQHRELMPGP